MATSKTSRKTPYPMALSNGQKKYLRGLGHVLNLIMQIGKEGITDAFVAQLSVTFES